MKEEGRNGDSPEPTFLPKEVSHLLIKGGRRGGISCPRAQQASEGRKTD